MFSRIKYVAVPVVLGYIVVLFGKEIYGFPPVNESVKQEDDLTSSQNKSYDSCMNDTNEMELDRSGNDVNHTKHLINRAICYMHQQKWDVAYNNIGEVLKVEPDNIMALINRGCIYLHWEMYREALENFLRARQLADEQNATLATKVQIFEWFMKAHRLAHEEVPLSVPEGEVMRLQELEEDAQWRMRANLCIDDHSGNKTAEKDVETLMKVGNRYFYELMFDEALKCYNKVIELRGTEAMHYRNRALCLMLKEEWTTALSDIEKAVEIEPNNVRGLFYDGLANYELKEYAVALDYLDKALQQANETTGLSFEEQQQMYTTLESICEAAVKYTPHNPKLIVVLSRALFKEGFHQQGIELLKEGLDDAEETNATSVEKNELRSMLVSAQEKISAVMKNEEQKVPGKDISTNESDASIRTSKVLKRDH